MSHTTTISNLVFTDVAALQAAADELRQRGIRCEMLENAIPRAYYNNQMTQAPLVLRLDDSRYDVGFYEDEGKEGLTPKCDLWGGDIKNVLGAPTEEGVNETDAALGKLRNAYAVQATTNAALQQGHQVHRQDGADGSVQLTVIAA